MIEKYNYHDFTGSNGKPLPEDINKIVFTAGSRLDPTGDFNKVLEYAQRESSGNVKKFGDAVFVNPKSNLTEGYFEFHNGVCKMFKLVKYIDDILGREFSGNLSHFQHTFLNPAVDFKRRKK